MTGGKFDIIFEHMDKEKEMLSQIDAIRDTAIQSEEIRKLAEIVRDMKSAKKLILYSGT